MGKRSGQAKAYQVKQVRGVIVAHRLASEFEIEPRAEGTENQASGDPSSEGDQNGQ